jgi:5-methylcytosine-specific restriction protein A
MVLALAPLCLDCLAAGRVTPATDVHHVKPLRTHPHLRLDPSNLRALCAPCHNAINDYAQR